VIAVIDGHDVCSIVDDFHPNGAVALASSYDRVEFDNLTIDRFKGRAPEPAAEFENLALGTKVIASSQSDSDHTADKAVDGNHATGWCSGKTADQWLEVDFGSELTFSRTVVDQHRPTLLAGGGDVAGYKIQYWEGDGWKDAAIGANMALLRHTDDFAPVTARRLRLFLAACGEHSTVYEFQVFRRKP